ncbi:MAG: hypothetical protein JWM41_2607 [Gemmatimonadetes bacterium]|nr:hypothetical protein [Gemmatimonadota bacterium]
MTSSGALHDDISTNGDVIATGARTTSTIAERTRRIARTDRMSCVNGPDALHAATATSAESTGTGGERMPTNPEGIPTNPRRAATIQRGGAHAGWALCTALHTSEETADCKSRIANADLPLTPEFQPLRTTLDGDHVPGRSRR